MPAVSDLSLAVGTARACDALGLARASYYRGLQPQPPARVTAPDQGEHRFRSKVSTDSGRR